VKLLPQEFTNKCWKVFISLQSSSEQEQQQHQEWSKILQNETWSYWRTNRLVFILDSSLMMLKNIKIIKLKTVTQAVKCIITVANNNQDREQSGSFFFF